MNGSITIEFSQISIIINVILRLITAFIFIWFIIPLQIKQADVRNGLRLLRTELLVSGVILFLINTIGLGIIIVKPFTDPKQLSLFTDFIALFNSVGFLIVAAIKFQIYHSQYTPENILMHQHFERIEVAHKKEKNKK